MMLVARIALLFFAAFADDGHKLLCIQDEYCADGCGFSYTQPYDRSSLRCIREQRKIGLHCRITFVNEDHAGAIPAVVEYYSNCNNCAEAIIRRYPDGDSPANAIRGPLAKVSAVRCSAPPVSYTDTLRNNRETAEYRAKFLEKHYAFKIENLADSGCKSPVTAQWVYYPKTGCRRIPDSTPQSYTPTKERKDDELPAQGVE